MKKLIALMLSLMLLVGLALPVLAEEEAPHKHTVVYDDSMSVEMVIPEGYTVEETNVNGALLLIMEPVEENANYFCTLIAHDDEYAEVERLNDLTEEQLQEIVDEFCEDLNNPTVSYGETGMGTKLFIVDDNGGEESDTAVVVTLYKGYFLTTYVFPAGTEVTEAELNTAIQFYTDMDFKF